MLCDSTTLVVFLSEQHQGGRDGGVDLNGQRTRRGIVVGERRRALTAEPARTGDAHEMRERVIP